MEEIKYYRSQEKKIIKILTDEENIWVVLNEKHTLTKVTENDH